MVTSNKKHFGLFSQQIEEVWSYQSEINVKKYKSLSHT
jgi:hypothetical protein